MTSKLNNILFAVIVIREKIYSKGLFIMTEGKDKKDKKKDVFSIVMITQFVVCTVLLAIMFILCRGGFDAGESIRSQYDKLMERDFSSDDYKEVYSAADAFIKGERLNPNIGINQNKPDESESVPMGGNDIHSDNLSVLEGISFEEYHISSKYIKPLDDYTISSPFGYREDPISGGNGVHTGIDLASAAGNRIKASNSGKVVKAEYSDGYGYYVLLAHDDGFNTLYAHCSELKCSAGDIVEQGDTVALVGSTGNSTGNHLHFEIRRNGVKLNPSYAVEL